MTQRVALSARIHYTTHYTPPPKEARGKQALRELSDAVGDKAGGRLEFRRLDIADAASVAEFAEWLAATHPVLTVLVNNAGMAYKGSAFDADKAAETIATNYAGSANLTEALLPALRAAPPGTARVVNVSSS